MRRRATAGSLAPWAPPPLSLRMAACCSDGYAAGGAPGSLVGSPAGVDREPHVSTLPAGPVDRGAVFIATRPLDLFLRIEVRSSLLLLGATVAALIWANSPWVASYEALWTTDLSFRVGENELAKDLRHWVNDGLMTLCFLVAGLEIMQELKLRKRRDWAAVVVPVLAALGGMALPALLYLTVNAGPAGRGWPIVMATDLALALGLLVLAGRRCPPQLRNFVLVLVVVSNLTVVALITVLYAEPVNLTALTAALALLAVVPVVRLLPVLRTFTYVMVGVGLWVAMSASGLHPAVMGVLLGVVFVVFTPRPTGAAGPARTPDRPVVPASRRLPKLLHPWSSYLMLPLFALANAGITMDRDLLARAVGSSITLGVITGLVVGKLLGVLSVSTVAVRAGLGTLPRLVTHRQLAAAAATAGIGFTMALFVADVVLVDRLALEEAKVGILVGSATAATLGWLLFSLSLHRTGGHWRPGGSGRTDDGLAGREASA